MGGIQPVPLSDADLYERFRDKGLSHAKAVLHVERRRKAQPVAPVGASAPTALEAGLISGAQGATAGFADELIGSMQAIRDPNVPLTGAAMDSSVANVRQRFADARGAHPIASVVGNIGGAAINPVNKLLGPLTAGVGPAAKGATHGIALGAMQGFGEGDGTMGERGLAAALGAVIGGGIALPGGYLIGKLAKPLSKIWGNVRKAFQSTERQVVAELGKGVSPQIVRDVQESAHMAFLQKQGFAQMDIDRIMETWRAGGRLPTRAPPTPTGPPTVRKPGETLTQISPKGFEVTGARATPPVPSSPTIAEMLGVTSRGNTLPYYPRGGAAEQAMAPLPVSSPTPGMGGQQQVFADFLRGATPADLPGRLDAIRALGVKLPPGADAELLALLTGAR